MARTRPVSSPPHVGPSADEDPGPIAGPGPLPRVFGRYVLFDRIGRGGMADIYLARADTGLGGSRLCVVKQILPELAADAAFERLLIAEAKLAARLTHANIVQVFDLGREADRLYIAMEYVEGFDLNQLLRALSASKVGLSSEFAIFIIREVLRGLDYAHRQRDAGGRPLGLVHRDVSPSNVLVSFEGEVRLCDFGIARALSAHQADSADAADHAPPQHRVVGKSAYMSPEHARGDDIDARADVFAAGILLWELCAGRRLYRGTEQQMLEAARKAEISPLPARGFLAHDMLQTLLDRALAPDRDARFQTAQEFLQALEEYAATARQHVSQLRFGAFLTDQFGARILELRRTRELSVRDLPSELPPPLLPRSVRPPREPADTQPTAQKARSTEPLQNSTSLTLDALPHMRMWSEPGMEDAPPPLSASLEGALAGAGFPTESSEQTLHSVSFSPGELDRSLEMLLAVDEPSPMGAEARSQHPASTPAQRLSQNPAPIAPGAAPADREWVWYLAALVILALGVLGYFWR